MHSLDVQQDPRGRRGSSFEHAFLSPCADGLLRQVEQLGRDARSKRMRRRQFFLDDTEKREAPVVFIGERLSDALEYLDALDQVVRLAALIRDARH